MLITISQLLAEFQEITLADGARDSDSSTNLGPSVESDRVAGVAIGNIASPESCDSSSLVFIGEATQVDFMAGRLPAAIVTTDSVCESIRPQALTSVLLVCANPRLTMSRVRRQLDDYCGGKCGWTGVHATAVIHPDASVAPDCQIGPGVVIGEGSCIGAGTRIDSQCVIEQGVKIGQRCHIHARVFIGYDSQLGDDVLIRPGAVVGGEGFGLVPNDAGRYERIPHTGRVVIHNDVIIGAQCNIDRGTFTDTVIEDGVRLDALVHIAHNVHIEHDALLLAQSVVAGSSTIGSRAILSGQCGVIDHKKVAPGAVLLHRAGVVRDIDEPGRYAGNPAVPLAQYLRANKHVQNLDKLNRRVRELESKLNGEEIKK